MTILNCTPHPINLLNQLGQTILNLPGCNQPPRLTQKTVFSHHIQTYEDQSGTVISVPITKTEFGEVEHLPEQKEGTFLIVSRLVLAACPGRSDLLVPNELVRDGKGRIIGCKSFANN
jgi:hypothetical protein